METIFNHNPTEKELISLRFDSFSFCLKFGIELKEELTPELYLKYITDKFAKYDIACLYEFRNDMKTAQKYWDMIPKKWQAYGLNYDHFMHCIFDENPF